MVISVSKRYKVNKVYELLAVGADINENKNQCAQMALATTGTRLNNTIRLGGQTWTQLDWVNPNQSVKGLGCKEI